MKLDVSMLRYLSKEDFRVLTSIEMGMKNHEIVPLPLIGSISKLKPAALTRSITSVHKHKLIYHDRTKYDGYKLTYSGYDYLSLRALTSRDAVLAVGNQIGVGKESDVFLALSGEDEEVILKIHRLGRISFRQVKNKRDYLKHRKSASWLYLSRLAALKEYAYMKALYDNGFPVPKPYDHNRHCIVMSRAPGYPMCQISKLRHPGRVYNQLMNLLIRFARYGLIHGDFNEFNIMISEEEEVMIIDFPQMVSTSHLNAEMYFDRDVQCIRTYFMKKFGYDCPDYPKLSDYMDKEVDLDVEVAASGFTKELRDDFELLSKETQKEEEGDDDDNEEDEEEEQEEDEEEKENRRAVERNTKANRGNQTNKQSVKEEEAHKNENEKENENDDENDDENENEDESEDESNSSNEDEQEQTKNKRSNKKDQNSSSSTPASVDKTSEETKDGEGDDEEGVGDEEAERKRKQDVHYKAKRQLLHQKNKFKTSRNQMKLNDKRKLHHECAQAKIHFV
eukprot:TRINITY_DN1896_c0_g1_i2.p1 TRINITY_DN1896_c0_g1~~TRINITY_DN1896_c0_g1_i2.p1  ORF type:complete len:507 (-),score=129.87 TRINITY_DN1896_c0_g1_i2:193-1713(-)